MSLKFTAQFFGIPDLIWGWNNDKGVSNLLCCIDIAEIKVI